MIDLLANLDWRAPWWGLLALQPLVFHLLARRRRQRLERYADPHLQPWAIHQSPETSGRNWRVAARAGVWLLLATAAAGPRLPLEVGPGAGPATHRHNMDIQVLLDVSASMAATDIAPTRLARAKLELDDLLARLTGERIGLIVYAGGAGVLSPTSDDPALFRRALELADGSLIETRGSRIEVALKLAARQITSRPGAILLVSDCDADSLVGSIGDSARAAADELARRGIPIYVLGVGDPRGAAIPLADGGYAERDGAPVLSRLDADACRALARGGGYASVVDGDGDWSALYDHGLARLPGLRPQATSTRAWQELYPWPLALALALLLLAGTRGGAHA
jgi:Ca-activated chloride channel family protein